MVPTYLTSRYLSLLYDSWERSLHMNAARQLTIDDAASAALPEPPHAGVTVAGDALSSGLVAVRHTGSEKGFGVFAAARLPENVWLGDYVGEVLTQDEYVARYPNEDADYVLGANEDYNVDARDPSKSSYCRYLNHAPAGPTCNVFLEIVRRRKQRWKDIKFYTGRVVAEGEELCFDYGRQYWQGRAAELVV